MDSNLKRLYSNLTGGAPVDSGDLSAWGISADLAVYYVRAGWLRRLARGVYSHPNELLNLNPSLRFLERKTKGLHVGGKTALGWYNIRHYVAQRETLHLYGWAATRLPAWFLERFPAEYHRLRLFQEKPEALMNVTPLDNRPGAPRVSEPERALLEMLNEVGVRQPLEEARKVMEGTYTLRVDALRTLLKACTSVKTVRLCLQWGKELSLPWSAKLDTEGLPTGSKRAWVSRTANGLLVLKP